MNKMRIFFFLLISTSSGLLIGQTKLQFIKAAEREFANKNYYGALEYFNTALEFDPNDPIMVYKAAESARQFNAYDQAAKKYAYLIDTLNDSAHPDAVFYLAMMKQNMGKYDEARLYYNRYITEFGTDEDIMTQRAKKEMSYLDYAQAVANNPKKNIKIERLGADVNTPFSEVSPLSVGSDFYFSSMKFVEQKPAFFPAKEVSKLLKSKDKASANLVNGAVNDRDLLVSNISISKDGKTAYYTVCSYINSSDIHCEIYKSTIDSNGELVNEVKLPDPINIPGSTATHPHITIDKNTGREILYFVSDRAEGVGGYDIWYSLLDTKFGFSQPINLKAVNTPLNEITPYYNTINDFLYFSAEGREGLGGYDIYKISKINDVYGATIGLGAPFNSSYHDIYYTESQDGSEVYLSSNREGAAYLDELHKSCCYDIYKLDVDKVELDLNALTYDKLTGRPLKGATVKIYDQTTNLLIDTIYSQNTNEHITALIEDRNYYVVATRPNYYPDTVVISTMGMDKTETIVKKMYLSTDMILLDAFTFTKIGNFPLDSVTVTIKDLTDPSKRNIVEFNPLNNEFNFMLDRGKEFQIFGTKDGYSEAIDNIDTRPYDKSALIRKDLFLDKFILQDLLPISLYFDNDSPDLNSKASTTKAVYGDLVQQYVNQKETYKVKYSKPLPDAEKARVKEEYEIFFEGDVRGGYDKFKRFTESLVHELEAGNKVELILKGFASPRADSKYNLALGQRRVNAVKNDLVNTNEALRYYFQNGQLELTDISFGKELAPEDVEGSISDERNSIYNLKAARERRVEILRAARN
jgi:outer membrane protein OmpA-like peptidoglycan-associated protein